MPVYTYRCDVCGFTFDQKLGFNDPQPSRCPECGAEALHRVYRPVGIVFKGSGFYTTDHRSPSGTKGNGNGKGGGSQTATESHTKAEPSAAESKPAKPAKPKKPASATAKTA